jgi:hypothetical protein
MNNQTITAIFFASILLFGIACTKSPNGPSSDVPAGKTQSVAWSGPDNVARKTTLYEPTDPVIGPQTLDILIGKKVDSLTFTPDTQWTITFSPTMPDMDDMTSPNNVQPKIVLGGHYQGTVNFSMSGLWRLTITLKHTGDAAIVSHYFDVTVK